MGRRRKYDYVQKNFRKTPVKTHLCKKCNGYGWEWIIDNGENMKKATVHYRESCNKCMGTGENK